MKKQIFLLLFLLILHLFVVSAESGIDIILKNNTIDVKSYVFLGSAKQTNTIISDTLSTSLNCVSFDFSNLTHGEYNGTILTNCTNNLDKVLGLNLTDICSINETRIISINEETVINYTQCVNDKALITANKAIIETDCAQKNKTNDLYVKCNYDLGECNSAKTPLQTQIDTLNKEKEDSKNTKWIYAAIGLVIGIAGAMYYSGNWGRPKMKHPEENYNKVQSA